MKKNAVTSSSFSSSRNDWCALHVQIHNSCFFTAAKQRNASFLIANPPYIPAPDNRIMMPALHGGVDGAELTRVRLRWHCLHLLGGVLASSPV
jgi:methylase of polypeptide subunit release factors